MQRIKIKCHLFEMREYAYNPNILLFNKTQQEKNQEISPNTS